MTSSIRIVVAALGGEGGGVLAKWIADLADHEGYMSQTTSVPGVAQRTGATIYYVEIFPREQTEAVGALPVMSMFPTPGDVDIVICSEIVEAGRMIQRGFVTPDRTILVTSTHRVFGIAEKEAMGSGMVDKEAIIEVALARAKTCIGFDMLETARKFDSVINAALFGALAQTGALPFRRGSFEETIRRGRIAVASNLQTFAASYELAKQQRGGVRTAVPPAAAAPSAFVLPVAATAEGEALLARIATFPLPAQEMIYLGVKKLIDYQHSAYARLYLDRLEPLRPFEAGSGAALVLETARYLALWMAFEDLPRVAQIKISPQRFQRFREEVLAEPEQQLGVVEFLHPRVEEFCGIMPAPMGRFVLGSPALRRLLGLLAKPRTLRTNSVHGFLLLYLMAKLRRLRPYSLVYQLEHTQMEQWLEAICAAASTDYDLALELARCGRLVKGYGDTRERGTGNLQRILAVYPRLHGHSVRALRDAAMADEAGVALAAVEARLLASSQGAVPPECR